MKKAGNHTVKKIGSCFIRETKGNSIPLVMLVALVVMIVGGAVAYSAVQMFTIARGEAHSQMVYFAAESALERSLCNLDSVITKEGYAASRGIVYTGEDHFITALIDEINSGNSDNDINIDFNDLAVYGSTATDNAKAKLNFSWNGEVERLGLKRLRFPVTVTAEAEMEYGIFKSYGKKAVATKEFTVWISDRFRLNGAVYTLGDMLAKTTDLSPEPTEIQGDVYVFGTGLDKAKRKEQHYNGGICAVDSAVLHINGNAFTRNLVRAGTFDENELSPSCAIVVDEDIVAQGIQVFGSNDAIVAVRDAYTFDDLELSGAKSYIAVNGNYFGLNPGDGLRHDTSSAVINVAPQYGGGLDNNYMKSRIVINGHALVNGATFRIKDVETGEAGHKMEGVSLAWDGNKPVYIAAGIEADETMANYNDYILALNGSNGFSVLIQNDWEQDNLTGENWVNWENWISEIRGKAGCLTNSLPSFPGSITGFCNIGMAANNGMFFMDSVDYTASQIKKPSSVTCHLAEKIEGLESNYFNPYLSMEWEAFTGLTGMPVALEDLMNVLQDHVQVFAGKSFSDNALEDEINYEYTAGLYGKTEFMTLADHLKDEVVGTPKPSYVLRYEETSDVDPVDVGTDLAACFTESDPHTDHYFMILNFNPDKALHITSQVNGIIFSMGKVVVEKDGLVNGAIIAAGRGYDKTTGVNGSAAEYDEDGNPRLPRVVGESNINQFKNWEYAAVVFDNGGSVVFPGREELFELMINQSGFDFDLYDIF